MNLIKPNFGSTPGGGPDELDILLGKFFRAQMPHPWPRLTAPITDTPPISSWWMRSRSRLALAASVAILIVGSWWLAGRTLDYSPGMSETIRNSGPGTADIRDRNKIIEAVKKKEDGK